MKCLDEYDQYQNYWDYGLDDFECGVVCDVVDWCFVFDLLVIVNYVEDYQVEDQEKEED